MTTDSEPVRDEPRGQHAEEEAEEGDLLHGLGQPGAVAHEVPLLDDGALPETAVKLPRPAGAGQGGVQGGFVLRGG